MMIGLTENTGSRLHFPLFLREGFFNFLDSAFQDLILGKIFFHLSENLPDEGRTYRGRRE